MAFAEWIVKIFDMAFYNILVSIFLVFNIHSQTQEIDSLIANKNYSLAEKIILSSIETNPNNEVLITADTIVVVNNNILTKPKDKKEAFSMIKSLSGKEHKVITSVCITLNHKQNLFSEETIVRFNIIKDDEIRYYIDNYNVLDKSGSYGIQDWIGLIGIRKITGSFYNVMGLPTFKLYEQLQKLNKWIIVEQE